MAELDSDMEIKKKGMTILFKNLGEVDAVRFLSQIAYEKRDYHDEKMDGLNGNETEKKLQTER